MKLERKPPSEKSKGGRPRHHNFDEIFEQLAAPPTDPAAFTAWAQGIRARLTHLVLVGKYARERVQLVRALLRDMERAHEQEQLWRAADLLRSAAAPAKPQKRRGPEMQVRGRRNGVAVRKE